MKKFLLLFVIFSFTTVSCNHKQEGELSHSPSHSTYISDNSELEEAKAITRKLFEGLKKVEENQLSREDFEGLAEPLQRKLNSLILSMEDRDAQALEAYKNELMVRLIEENKNPSNS